MGRLQVVISDSVEKQLRTVVEKEYGSKKGAISIIFEQALRDWLSARQKK